MRKRHTFEGLILAQSPKAILFQSWFWWAALWLPRSQITVHEDEDSDEKVVVVSAWLAGKNDLEEFTEYTQEDIDERTYNL